ISLAQNSFFIKVIYLHNFEKNRKYSLQKKKIEKKESLYANGYKITKHYKSRRVAKLLCVRSYRYQLLLLPFLFVFDTSINLCPYIPPKKISVSLKMPIGNLLDISFDGKNYANPLM